MHSSIRDKKGLQSFINKIRNKLIAKICHLFKLFVTFVFPVFPIAGKIARNGFITKSHHICNTK